MKKKHFRQLCLLGAAGFFNIWNGSVAFGNPAILETTLQSLNIQEPREISLSENLLTDENEVAETIPSVPIEMSADYLEYNHSDGGFSGSGRVRIFQGSDTLRSEVALGNAQTGEIFFPEEIHITGEESSLLFSEGRYNYNEENGELFQGKGQVKNRYFTGEKAILSSDQMEIQNAKFAKDISLLEEDKNPAVWIKADRTIIIPNQKMTVYKPWLYMGPHRIMRLPTYTVSLDPNDKKSEIPFPKVGYDSDRGVYVSYNQAIGLPAGILGNLTVGYYSKDNFKYDASIFRSTPVGSFRLTYGETYNSTEDVWVKKSPELTYRTPSFKIGKTGFSVYGFGLAGHWKEGTTESDRYEAESWITHRPIFIGPMTNLSFGVGIRYIYEEAYDNDFSQLRGFVHLEHQFNPRVYGSLSIEGNSENKSRFQYRSTGYSNIIRPFLMYKIDNRNQIQAGFEYDIDQGKIQEYKAGWYYDLRGFQLEFTYTRDQYLEKNKYNVRLHTRMF